MTRSGFCNAISQSVRSCHRALHKALRSRVMDPLASSCCHCCYECCRVNVIVPNSLCTMANTTKRTTITAATTTTPRRRHGDDYCLLLPVWLQADIVLMQTAGRHGTMSIALDFDMGKPADATVREPKVLSVVRHLSHVSRRSRPA